MQDLCVRETYTKDGTEHTSWNKIGIMFSKGEKTYVKLFHLPGTLITAYDQKKKTDMAGQKTPF